MVFAGSLFDLSHLLYIASSLTLTALSLRFGATTLKLALHKDRYLRFWATLSFIFHTSILWVDYLRYGEVVIPSYFLFPTFLCNITLALLVALAYWPEPKGNAFQSMATFTAYSGVLSGLLALFYPMYYLQGPSIFEWGVFKSLASHTAMTIGCFYLFFGGYVTVKTKDSLTFAVGLAGCGLLGFGTNTLFDWLNLPSPNAMFLEGFPVEVPGWFNVYILAFLLIALVALFSAYVYPMVQTRIEERTFNMNPEKKAK